MTSMLAKAQPSSYAHARPWPHATFFGLTRTLATMFPGVASPSLQGDPLLATHDIWKTLGTVPVLAGVTLCIRDRVVVGRRMGQIVALLGPSGIGKTTLLKVLAGLETPDRGLVFGPLGRPLALASVGMVFQSSPLLRHRTALDNLRVAGRILGLCAPSAHDRAMALLERFHLANRAHAYPAELSGGERQRIAIAQQIMVPRAVLLLDEPFSGLDPSAANQVRAAIVEAADADDCNTVVLVTHDIGAALAAADQVLVLGRAPHGAGAVVRCLYDLVDLGCCARAKRECGDATALHRELRSLFRAL